MDSMQEFWACQWLLTNIGETHKTQGCCQTNEPKHQHSFDEYVYEVTKERHSAKATSRLSLNVVRFASDL